MVMTDNSDFLSQGEVESSVQSTNQQHPDSHELASLDRQSSIFSLTLDEFQHTFSGDIGSFGSMNIDELLDNILTEEEIQAYEQTLLPNPSVALSAAAPMAAATVPTAAATSNMNPTRPEGEVKTSTVNDTAIHREQEYGSTANVQEADSAQRQTTSGEMTLEVFLIKAGVIRAHDRPPSPPLQQSCVSYQNNNNTALGSGPPGCMVRPVMASGGGGNVPAYQALPERSIKDAASAAVGRIPSGYQPREVRYGGKMQNDTGKGGGKGSPASPVSSDSVGAMNNLDMDVNVADRCSGPVEKVVARKQRRMIKNRESAARSRARRQAYTRDLEAQLQVLQEENARLQEAAEAMEAIKRKKQQYMEEFMKARKAKDGKKGLKRSWSWMY